MRKISAADYMVEFFIANEITDVFGYQGGMVCHIFDSLGIYRDKINYHSCGNEQGAAIAACAYSQATGKLGVVITTSGPGFTNALTGLANAWFDSVPVMLISGQVNTKDKRRNYPFRQFGFQEIQAVEMAKPVVKKVYEVDDDTDIVACMTDAFQTAMNGRKGPVYIDMPINMERAIVNVDDVVSAIGLKVPTVSDAAECMKALLQAKKPIIIAGGGIAQSGMRDEFIRLVDLLKIPVVPTMAGNDLIPEVSDYRVGFFGGTARREASVVLYNTDCVLTLGTRLCNKAIGYSHDQFIPKATKFMRVDIDTLEFERQLKDFEEDITADLRTFIPSAISYLESNEITDHSEWVDAVNAMQEQMSSQDLTFGNEFIKSFTELLPENTDITLDVGNNLIYGEQSSVIKKGTRLFASCGLGSMGYSIPAALGVAIGGKKVTCAVTGDGGAQMNIQELNTIAKMNLPVKVLVMNNRALGHIIIFQEHYLDNRLVATTEDEKDYYSCDFTALGKAYGIRSFKVHRIDELEQYKDILADDEPALFELEYENCTMLPNIHGGLDPLTNGPELPQSLVASINELMSK